MATVDELLGDVVDKTLVISNDFRKINIPSSVPNLGVEHDDDVLRLDFKMPRYVSDTDLSTFAIRINYMNAQRETDAYTVNDAKIDENDTDYITFSWLVGPTATKYKGDTKFIVCAKTLNDDDVVDKEFNTTIASLQVLEGLEVDEAVVTEYSDIIEQWRQELFGIGDTEEASIRNVAETERTAIKKEGAQIVASIPEEMDTWFEEHFDIVNDVVYGKSAYEIARERGFQGTEAEWLESLKGPIPVKGVDYFTQSDKDEIATETASRVTPIQIITWEEDD